jgi:predicted Zn-dependent protease
MVNVLIKIALLLLLILSGCATTSLPPITSSTFATLEEDEKGLWRRSEEEQGIINRSDLIYKDEELENYLNEIARKLTPPEVLNYIQFKVKVIKNPYLNAFSYPNGVIYVHTGILARMDNEAQLATLLGHEITHITHRHAVRTFRDIKNKTAFLATLQVSLAVFKDDIIRELVNILGMIGTIAAISGYSKKLETEADIEGFKLMLNAGYDPYEAPKLFEYLKKELEDEQIKEPFFFGTHPRLQERIQNYNSFLAQLQYPNVTKNTEVFLQKTKNVILDNAFLDLKAGRFNMAKRGAEKYLSIKPDDARAYYLLGEIHRQRGEKDDPEKAKENYERAISLDPSFPDSYKGLGMIYYKQGEKALAKKYFELYLSVYPKAPDKAYIEEYLKTLQER